MGNAFFLVVAGLLLFYVVISDKFYCIEGCIACLGGEYVPADKGLPVTAPTIGGGLHAPATIGGVLGIGQ